MWELDVGCVPVVDEEGRPVAMLTDRDVCMAAYTTGKRLSQLKVQSAMSRGFFSCKADDGLAEAESTMRDWQVRRLPVVDASDRLVGVLSITDIVRARSANALERAKERVVGDLADTLSAICRHR
jgi:CBS domain-containing protein